MFMWPSMLVEGSGLNIEIYKKQLWTISTREPGPEEGPTRKANIKFDDLRKHLSSRTGTDREEVLPRLLLIYSED